MESLNQEGCDEDEDVNPAKPGLKSMDFDQNITLVNSLERKL